MIEEQSSREINITISNAEPWNDAFEIGDGTRPLPSDWTAIELFVRPDFDHPTLIRKLSTDGDDPDATSVEAEIIVDDQERAAFSFKVPHSVTSTLSPGVYVHILNAVYVEADNDTREIWRGRFIVKPGRTA